ncbi:MAG: hypothetical protein JSW52_02215 [Candidatus Coatesbacteria bacterium]|nr:MAG: hypothetical protein JSW52_02215 [Candidatus Coatesbacteria bacterium]
MKKALFVALASALLPAYSGAMVCGFGFGGGLALPIANYADAAGLSAVGAGEFSVCISPKFSVNVRGAYRIKHTGKEGDFSANGEYKSIIFWAGPAYRFDFYPVMLFVNGAAGLSKNDFKYPYLDAEGNEHTGATEDYRFIAYGGGGMDYRLTDSVSLELSGGVSSMFGGEAPGGVSAQLKEGMLPAIDFAAMLKFYLM